MRFAAALLIPFVLCLASCGGGSGRENVQSLLDKAFAHSIHSANMRLDATIQVSGVSSLDKPIRISASGPFKGNKGKLPLANIDLGISTGSGQTVQSGFLSTGKRAFVKFQDVYYEQPAAEVRKANQSLQARPGKRRTLASLGLDPRSWVTKARDRGDETVAGAATTHVSGTIAIKRMLSDLNQFVRRSQGALGSATGGQPPKPLRAEDIDAIAKVVSDPTFDIYVGKDDDTIHRMAGRLEVKVPAQDRSQVGGANGGALQFSIEFRNVNGNQKVEAPDKARPLSDLTSALGTSGLQGLGGGGSRRGPERQKPPTATTGPNQQSFKKYSDCLEKSNANDTAALQRCAQLLQR